jgi:hypothetical protein
MIKVLEEVGIIKFFLTLFASGSVWFDDRCRFSSELDLPTNTLVWRKYKPADSSTELSVC